ncbi:MAG: hypothetical protein IJ776_08510 [Paludibacteraceae bacterium]|nr:hypothetical protein [Paludibacteraceae bacterium]
MKHFLYISFLGLALTLAACHTQGNKPELPAGSATIHGTIDTDWQEGDSIEVEI